MRFLSLLFLAPIAYQSLAIVAVWNHFRRRALERKSSEQPYQPAVSVLKPLRGTDPNILDAFTSQATQDYPQFELLFGVADANDPAAEQVRRLQQRFPQLSIRLLVGQDALMNGKVGVLANLARHAQFPVWVVNDSDIAVTPEYLSRVVAPLRNTSVGLVTCLYRARAHELPALWESLGVATDFMPSTLVAQLIGVREFGLGSTLAFRAADLESAGGFAAIGDYLADDYQLAKRIVASGKRALVSTYTVETSLGDTTWSGSWQHQLRWARTIRASKGGGFAGLPIAQAGLWIAIALAAGLGKVAGVLLLLRLLSALSGAAVVASSPALKFFWLSPLWDLYSFAVWLTSYGGREVRWRDRVLTVDKQGRIRKE